MVKDITHFKFVQFPIVQPAYNILSLYILQYLPSAYLNAFVFHSSPLRMSLSPQMVKDVTQFKFDQFPIFLPTYNILIVINITISSITIASLQLVVTRLFFISDLCPYLYPHTWLKKLHT